MGWKNMKTVITLVGGEEEIIGIIHQENTFKNNYDVTLDLIKNKSKYDIENVKKTVVMMEGRGELEIRNSED